jgi:DNA polymerase III sliding clamp (beta) subunit (PCNA family)
MDFKCDSIPFLYALEKCARMVTYKENYPEARNVLIVAENSKLSVSVTDVISGAVTYYVHDTVSIKKEGTIAVDANTLKVFVDAVSGIVHFYITKAGRLMAKCGSSKISLAANVAIPDIQSFPDDTSAICRITGSMLKSVLSIAFMSAPEDTTIEGLKGTLLAFDTENIYSMAAASGRAGYTWHALESHGSGKFNLPPTAVNLLAQYLYDDDMVEVALDNDEKKLWFNAGRFIMYTVQINAKFPYEAVSQMIANKRPYSFSVDNNDARDVLNTCFKMARVTAHKNSRIYFYADDTYKLVTVKTDEANEIGELNWSIVQKKSTGHSLRFILSSIYLESIVVALEKLKSSDLMMELSGNDYVTFSVAQQEENLGPVYIASPNMQALFIIAPMGFPELVEDSREATHSP